MDPTNTFKVPEDLPPEDKAVVRATYSYRQEAYIAKRDRMIQNRLNYDTYNLKGDFSHKKRGQSKEFLPKQALAVEQISSFFHQAMLDAGEWFEVDSAPGYKQGKIKPSEIKKLLMRQLDKTKFDEQVVDALKLGLIGSLAIMKVHGHRVTKPHFYTMKSQQDDGTIKDVLYRKDRDCWELKIDLVRQEDWFPDPTGDGLYFIQQIEMDYHQLKALSEGPNAIYDPKMVQAITGGFEDAEQVARKARETGQNQTFTSYRKRVRLWECWGTLIDPTTGEVLAKDSTWTVANDVWLIQKPRPYPFWHGSHPFVVAPIVRTPKSVWHKALMDAPTMLNIALNEAYNLALDAGIMAAFGIKQLRTDWLADETKVADGIAPGDTLEVNSNCPPGAKVLEPVQTITMSPEFMQMFNLTNSEFAAAAITNDLRMGVLPARAVKATEVVEASQTITSMFTGMARVLEQNLIVQALDKAWATIAQNADDMDSEEVAAILGRERMLEINGMSAEERFKETAQGYKFRVFGVSMILNRMKDYKKLMSFLQTIGGVQPLTEEALKKYDMGKILEEVVKSLDIDPSKIAVDPEEAAAMKGQAGAGAGAAPQGPDEMSQIPQVMGSSNDFGSAGGPQPAQGSQMPQANFPPSKATSA